MCCGMLHHLDLSYAFPELRRILSLEGKILAIEALDYNPIIKLYRNIILTAIYMSTGKLQSNKFELAELAMSGKGEVNKHKLYIRFICKEETVI